MTAFYPILNSSPDVDGYFEIPGKFTGMFTPGFQFVAVDNTAGSPIVSSATTFTTLSSLISGGNTRITPTSAIPAPTGTWVTLVGGAYAVNYSDPATSPNSIIISVGSFDGTTTLNLPGRAVLNYGETIATNFLHLLENFASTSSPSNPTEGQLWYEKGVGIKVHDGVSFIPVAASGISLPDLADVTISGSPISIGDVLTWTGSNWDSQSVPGVEDGTSFDYVVAGASQVINTTNVTTTANTGTTAYIQVFRNGILQREDTGSPGGGSYTITGANQITFTGVLSMGDEVSVYQL